MARPKKTPNLRKDMDLRIPVTADQKELVTQAATEAGLEMAPWARGILLEAAQKQLGGQKSRRTPP